PLATGQTDPLVRNVIAVQKLEVIHDDVAADSAVQCEARMRLVEHVDVGQRVRERFAQRFIIQVQSKVDHGTGGVEIKVFEGAVGDNQRGHARVDEPILGPHKVGEDGDTVFDGDAGRLAVA